MSISAPACRAGRGPRGSASTCIDLTRRRGAMRLTRPAPRADITRASPKRMADVQLRARSMWMDSVACGWCMSRHGANSSARWPQGAFRGNRHFGSEGPGADQEATRQSPRWTNYPPRARPERGTAISLVARQSGKMRAEDIARRAGARTRNPALSMCCRGWGAGERGGGDHARPMGSVGTRDGAPAQPP